MPFDDDSGTEAEHLSDMACEKDESDLLTDAAETRQTMRSLYDKAKAAPVGSRVVCPACGKRHSKTSYQKVFCRNKGRGNCKDRYWNTVDEVRSIKAGGARLW
jgi:hypothetical protein